jgi:hypothetical protein
VCSFNCGLMVILRCSTRLPCTRIYRRLSTHPPHRHYNTDTLVAAAEQEWLQAEIISVVPDLASPPNPRFDWRLRAPSRFPEMALDPQSQEFFRRYSVKRLRPQLVDVQKGESYFEEIQSYQEK